MKKVVLVLVCSLIMTIFIAFNYLLWDRDKNIKSLENLNDSKNASIEALSRELELNRQFKFKILELEDGNRTMQSRNLQLEQEKNKLKAALDQKNEIVAKFRQSMDTKPLEDTVAKWADSVDKGQYQAAYDLIAKPFGGQDISLNDFTVSYKASIKNIKLKSLKLITEGLSDEKKGEIIFKAGAEVKRVENSAGVTFFTEGAAEVFITMQYVREKDVWLISDISAGL